MSSDLFAWVVVLLVVVSVLLYLYRKKPLSKENKLYEECRRQLKMPPAEADKVIERYISRLKERQPGRSREWYLEKILYDLERDRR